MSGMKFRLKCGSCGATFFDSDRRARYCPKCAKKHSAAPSPAAKSEPPAAPPKAFKPPSPPKPSKPPKPQRPPKAVELTPEQHTRLAQLYQERWAEREFVWREVVQQFSEEFWVKRQTISAALRALVRANSELTPALRAQLAARYRGYVERGERPEGGRRRAIAREFKLPFHVVRQAVFEDLLASGAHFPAAPLTREQLFEIEKRYFAALERERVRLAELPAQLAAELGFVTPWQVQRWLDQLHDDETPAQRWPSVTPAEEAQLIAAYRAYLTAPAPPEQGLHFTFATQFGLSQRQVHKVLLAYRWRLRRAYPWP